MDNNIHINPESIEKFKAIKDIPIPEGYESPIEVYIRHVSEEITESRENAIMAQITEQIGVNVDKDELARALNYDRNQYNEGYRKGYFAAQEIYEETWTPVTYRPMTPEEVKKFAEKWGLDVDSLSDDEKLVFDCQMPDDEQEILISTRWGVEKDICTIDIDAGYGLEGREDWEGVDAWRPLPKPYKTEEQDLGGDEE